MDEWTRLHILFITDLDILRCSQRGGISVTDSKSSICCASISQYVLKLIHRVGDDRYQFLLSEDDAAQVKAIEDCEDCSGRLVKCFIQWNGPGLTRCHIKVITPLEVFHLR